MLVKSASGWHDHSEDGQRFDLVLQGCTMSSDGFPYPVDLPGNFSRAQQGALSDEDPDPLKAAIWQALMPFAEELQSTGGVTFMGLRNSLIRAVEPFIEQHRCDATGWRVEYKEARRKKNEANAESIQLRNALKEEAHWHDRKARELGKQPPSIDRNWRMGVHRERRDAICPLVGWPEGGPAWGEMGNPT